MAAWLLEVLELASKQTTNVLEQYTWTDETKVEMCGETETETSPAIKIFLYLLLLKVVLILPTFWRFVYFLETSGYMWLFSFISQAYMFAYRVDENPQSLNKNIALKVGVPSFSHDCMTNWSLILVQTIFYSRIFEAFPGNYSFQFSSLIHLSSCLCVVSVHYPKLDIFSRAIYRWLFLITWLVSGVWCPKLYWNVLSYSICCE